MPSHPLPPLDPARGYRPEKFQNKSTLRDYAIYALLLAFLASLIGVPLYYFTRSPAEKNALRAKFGPLVGAANQDSTTPANPASAEKPPVAESPAARLEPAPVPPTGNVSVYAGRTQSVVLRSADPQSPEASPEFLQFVEALKVSGVVQGNPPRAILNGKTFRAGESVDSTLGVTFAGLGLDDGRKHLLFRDTTGAELRLTY